MQLRGRNGEPQEAPAWLALTADGINKDDVATSQIDNIWLPLCGAFTGTPVAGLKETVLLQSSKDSQLVDAMLANLSGENIMKEFKPSGVNYALAIRLTGKFKTAFPDGAPQDKKDDKADSEKKDEKKPEEKKPVIRSRRPKATIPWCCSATPTCSTIRSPCGGSTAPSARCRWP